MAVTKKPSIKAIRETIESSPEDEISPLIDDLVDKSVGMDYDKWQDMEDTEQRFTVLYWAEEQAKKLWRERMLYVKAFRLARAEGLTIKVNYRAKDITKSRLALGQEPWAAVWTGPEDADKLWWIDGNAYQGPVEADAERAKSIVFVHGNGGGDIIAKHLTRMNIETWWNGEDGDSVEAIVAKETTWKTPGPEPRF